MLLCYLKGIPRTTTLIHRSMIRKRYNDARSVNVVLTGPFRRPSPAFRPPWCGKQRTRVREGSTRVKWKPRRRKAESVKSTCTNSLDIVGVETSVGDASSKFSYVGGAGRMSLIALLIELSRRNAIYIIATISTTRLRAEIPRQIRRLDVRIYFRSLFTHGKMFVNSCNCDIFVT